MNYDARESLATEFAEMIIDIRERQWDNFSRAAELNNLDPYIALSRLLVRTVEQRLEVDRSTDAPTHPCEDN